MSKDRLRELAADPAYISGIYNYCDRWCERCNFTGRCLNFATFRDQGLNADDDQSENVDGKEIDEKTIGHVTEIFGVAVEMIEDIAQKEGIDLSDVKPLPRAPPNTLSHRAKAYLHAVDEWIAKNELPLGACIDREERQIAVVGESSPTKGTAKAGLEICTRQRFLIVLKVARAFEHHEPAAIDEYDANGSAKTALVAIDESISAWLDIAKVVDHPFARSEVRGLVESLEQLRAQIERARPIACAFVRPGFDEATTENHNDVAAALTPLSTSDNIGT